MRQFSSLIFAICLGISGFLLICNVETLNPENIVIKILNNQQLLISSNIEFSSQNIHLFDLMGKAINFNLIEDNPNSKLIELDFKNILFLRIHDNKIDFTKTIYFQK